MFNLEGMFNPEDFNPADIDPNSLLVLRNRTADTAKIHIPVAGKIITTGLDTSMSELKSIDEILDIAKKHRRPPEHVVKEMEKRFQRFFMKMESIRQRHYAEAN